MSAQTSFPLDTWATKGRISSVTTALIRLPQVGRHKPRRPLPHTSDRTKRGWHCACRAIAGRQDQPARIRSEIRSTMRLDVLAKRRLGGASPLRPLTPGPKSIDDTSESYNLGAGSSIQQYQNPKAECGLRQTFRPSRHLP